MYTSRIRKIDQEIGSYIEDHKSDPNFSAAGYILNSSPLSFFLKKMKVTEDIVEKYRHRAIFTYLTYCIYYNIFVYQDCDEVVSSYKAEQLYMGVDKDIISTYKTELKKLKQTYWNSVNVGPGVKVEYDESFARIKEMIVTGRPSADKLSFGERALAKFFRQDKDFDTYVYENKEYILNSFAQEGWLRDIVSTLIYQQGSKTYFVTPKFPAGCDPVEATFGFSLADVSEVATKFQEELMSNIDRYENFLMTRKHEEELKKEQNTMDDSLYVVGGSTADIPQEIIKLAKSLERIHAKVSISPNNSKGIHISIPDPQLLEEDGIKELDSKHLSINAEMYLGIGRYDVDEYPTLENQEMWVKYRSQGKEVPCSQSMKTDKVYMVGDLLRMLPIEKRGLNFGNIKHTTIASTESKNLVDDGTGTMVPNWCGKTVPLSSLDPDHPAITYLKNRGFDPIKLEKEFDISYCVEAAPENRATGVYYTKLINGMRNTPFGRIVFPMWVNGHRVGYQSRLIETKLDQNNHFVWNGRTWSTIKLAGKEFFPPNEAFPKGFNPHKYLNAVGLKRNQVLLGYDQAVKWNQERHHTKDASFCILVEGPLDAAKLGNPAIAILGKFLSQNQADLIKEKFGKVIVVADNDEAGQSCKRRIYEVMNGWPIEELTVPHGKDAGDLSYEEAQALLQTSSFYKA